MNMNRLAEIATNEAIKLMVIEANRAEMGANYTASDIVSCVIGDPTGNAAFRLADLIATALTYVPVILEAEAA